MYFSYIQIITINTVSPIHLPNLNAHMASSIMQLLARTLHGVVFAARYRTKIGKGAQKVSTSPAAVSAHRENHL